jgi:hypothetical protein
LASLGLTASAYLFCSGTIFGQMPFNSVYLVVGSGLQGLGSAASPEAFQAILDKQAATLGPIAKGVAVVCVLAAGFVFKKKQDEKAAAAAAAAAQ